MFYQVLPSRMIIIRYRELNFRFRRDRRWNEDKSWHFSSIASGSGGSSKAWTENYTDEETVAEITGFQSTGYQLNIVGVEKNENELIFSMC